MNGVNECVHVCHFEKIYKGPVGRYELYESVEMVMYDKQSAIIHFSGFLYEIVAIYLG